MISKVEIRNKVVAYLEARGRSYSELSPVTKIQLYRQEKIAWGPRKGELDDIFVVSYVRGEDPISDLIFVHVSAHTGEIYFSQGPMNFLEELEAPEDPVVKEERKFVEEIFAEILEKGNFSLYDDSRSSLVYDSMEFNLEFQYEYRYERMNYGGLYVRLTENDNVYRLQDLIEFFDAEKRAWQEIIQPYKEKNDIALRIHAGVITSHLMEIITNEDISWEEDFKAFLKTKQPY